MTQPKLRVTNKPARLSSKGGNVWVKTIYIVPERPSDRAKSYGSIYGSSPEEATANASRFVRVHNATRELMAPSIFIYNAKETLVQLKNFAATREDIDPSKSITKQIIQLLSQ